MGPRTVLLSLLILPALVLADVTAADPKPENIITGLRLIRQPSATQLVLQAKKTPTFTVFKLKNPDRLIVDLLRTGIELNDVPKDVSNAHITRIATTQFKQAGNVVSRFIINLKPNVRFDAKADGSSVLVTVAGKTALSPGTSRVSTPKANPSKPPKVDSVEQHAHKKPSPQDHRVVESRGDKNRPGQTKIRRLVSDAGDSLTILADRDVETYQVLEVFKPFRIVLDIYGASMATRKHARKLSGKHAENLRAVRYQDKVRIVLDCADGKPQPYSVERIRRGLRIRFEQPASNPGKLAKVRQEQPASTTKPALQPQPKLPVSKPPPASVKPAMLRDVSFRQDDSEARVILDLEGQAKPQVVHADANSVILEISHCRLPLILERTLDTSEFGGAVQSLSAYRVRDQQKVKLVAVTSHQVANRLERRDGKLHWVFETAAKKAPLAASSAQKQGGSAYSYAPDQVAGYSVRRPEFQASTGGGQKRKKFRGRRISLDFKDADIHNILRLISEVAKLNIITSDEVKGKVTITMRNVPWDQALDIILKTKKLGKVRHGNIIRVATLSELTKERKMLREAAEANRQLEPLRVRLIAINYAVAKDIEPQVKDVLSSRGSVTVDERTNVLIVKDVLENLVKAEGLVRSLDTETPQVLIEARIVEANTQFVREVGVQWGGDMSFSAATGNPTGILFPSTLNLQGGADDTTTNNPFSGTGNPGQFAINLPAAVGAGSGGALGFIFGSAGGAARLNLRLSAMENKGTVKIISAPKIATLDNHKAKIGQGVSIPISVVSAAGVNTQFVEAKLELEVTPHITQEGSILMSIKVTKNEPDFSRLGARGDPTILKKEAETQVLVRDGDTTVIGGIYTKKTSDTVRGVPFLSKIPILGFFFRNLKKNDDRTELLIFITPRIVNRLRATVSQK